jgi:hemolysin III
MSPAVSGLPVRPKPLLRGVSHQIAFFVALAATALLVRAATSPKAAAAAAIYGASLSSLLGISALYHRKTWQPGPRKVMRRVDHSAIFLLIAGTYTPLFWLLDPDASHRPLWIVWVGAAFGIGKSMLWPHAPKWLTAALYLVLGWAVVGDVVRLRGVMGDAALWLLVLGGVVYSFGAIVYARRRPDPVPHVFGYHEIFHALVIVASACHFAHVILVLRAAG